MADPPADTNDTPDTGKLEAKFAAALDAERGARKDLELKYAALKEESGRYAKLVDEMKAAALDKEAEDAAMALVREGKVKSDGVAKFASLYKRLGKEEFVSLAADLPVTHLGVAQAKGDGTVQVAALGEKVKEKIGADVRAMMMKGGA